MINQVDKIIIGLVSVPLMKELHLSPSQWGVVEVPSFGSLPFPLSFLAAWPIPKIRKKCVLWMSFGMVAEFNLLPLLFPVCLC